MKKILNKVISNNEMEFKMKQTKRTAIKTCSFRCPEDVYKQLKIICAYEDTSVQDKVTSLVEKCVKNSTAFNKLNTSNENTRNLQQVSN